FGTLQKRLPQELRLQGITDMAEANRFLRESFLPAHNSRFEKAAEVGDRHFDCAVRAYRTLSPMQSRKA
ncbi:MAG: hypothetical protein LBC55_06385, partial [Desulfovibrio sp.]|nr:hypothetical protein [Desulfovibrio sp.]